MDKYCAKILMSSKDMDYDEMFTHCEIIKLQKPAKAGEVLDNMLILSGVNNEFEEGAFVVAVPLRYISSCTSPFDLSGYGFEMVGKESGCVKWSDFSKMPHDLIAFERALQGSEWHCLEYI